MSVRTAMPHPVKTVGRAVSVRVGSATAGRRQLPSFILVGAQRAGTTSLYRALMSHPQIHSANYHKGVNYFDVNYHRDFAWYRGHFPTAAHLRKRGRRRRTDHLRGERLLHVPPVRAGADGPPPPGGPHPRHAARPGRARLLGLEARARPGLRDRAVRARPRPRGRATRRTGRADARRPRLPELQPPPPRLPATRPLRGAAGAAAAALPRGADPRGRERGILRAARDDATPGFSTSWACRRCCPTASTGGTAARARPCRTRPEPSCANTSAATTSRWPSSWDGSPHGCPDRAARACPCGLTTHVSRGGTRVLIGVLGGIGLLAGIAWSMQQPSTFSATTSVALAPVPKYVTPSTTELVAPEVTIDTDAPAAPEPEGVGRDRRGARDGPRRGRRAPVSSLPHRTATCST